VLEPGERFDRYVVEELIGKGGMAAVYKVRHQHLGSLHAMKVLLISLPAVRQRLMQEGRVQAGLRHPNIVAVTDVLMVDRSPALVMEYVEGPSLEDLIEDDALSLDDALQLFEGVVLGVGAAHAAGVVHRDLKPGNVLLARTQHGLVPKVMDFGLVKALDQDKGTTVTGAALGTPAYMAPEQIRDPSAVDQRADLWGLGCLLYELVTGARAFPDEDAFDLYDAIRDGVYVDPREHVPDLPDRIHEVISELLKVDRDARIGSCEELYERLYDKPLLKQDERRLQLRGFTPEPAERMREIPPPPSAAAPEPEPESEAPTEESVPAPVAPASGVGPRQVALGVVVVLLLVGLGWGATQLGGDPTTEGTDRTARVEQPVPTVEPDVPEPVSQPVPQPEAPVPVSTTDGTADPVPAPTPQPAPVVPRPQVVQPQPVPVAPEPSPQPEAGTADPELSARVKLMGDAEEVWLERDGKRYELSEPVPPGKYTVFARFADGGTVTESTARLDAGEQVVLNCQSFLFNCAVSR
jgi:serine/threonine-protein kinase